MEFLLGVCIVVVIVVFFNLIAWARSKRRHKNAIRRVVRIIKNDRPGSNAWVTEDYVANLIESVEMQDPIRRSRLSEIDGDILAQYDKESAQ